jgi:hypothetical protein
MFGINEAGGENCSRNPFDAGFCAAPMDDLLEQVPKGLGNMEIMLKISTFSGYKFRQEISPHDFSKP